MAEAEWRHPRFVYALHLLWTLPVAALISIPCWFYGAINICGVSGCSGGGFGVSYGPEAANWFCAGIIAAIFYLSIALIPWSPWWIRHSVGLVVGLGIAIPLLAMWLGAKYNHL